jgi:hypothetical protein
MRGVWMAIRARLNRLSPRVILAFGWVALFVYGFPGIMSLESIRQIAEGRDGVYTDLTPALVSGLWRVTTVLFGGPFGMFLIQITLFVIGLFFVLGRALSERAAAIATSLVTVFPPVLVVMGVVWKEALMAGPLLLGVAGLTADRRAHRLWGLGACAFAAAVCYSAIAVTLPLIVILFTWFPIEATWRSRLRRYAVAAVAWLAVTLTACSVNAVLTDKELYPWSTGLALFDTVGTLKYADGDLTDDQVRELTRGTELLVDQNIHAAMRARYRPADFDALIATDGRLWDVSRQTALPEARRDAISNMFWATVTDHPGAYLHHRWALFELQLATNGFVWDAVMQHRFQDKELMNVYLSLTTNSSGLQESWQRRFLRWAKKTPIQVPWIYLVIAFILLPLCRGSRDTFALLLSGIALAIAEFFVALIPDYRFVHWTVLATTISIVMLVARRASQRTRSGA